MIYIGNHLSSSKGFEAMGKAALKLGANTFAFFTRNPRGGAAKAIDPADVEKLLEVKEEDLNLVMTGKVFPEKLKPYVDAISRIEYIQVDKNREQC